MKIFEFKTHELGDTYAINLDQIVKYHRQTNVIRVYLTDGSMHEITDIPSHKYLIAFITAIKEYSK